jgi:hypothetical protein
VAGGFYFGGALQTPVLFFTRIFTKLGPGGCNLRSAVRVGFIGALAVTGALADVTFDQSVKFTGGSMIEMMRRMANNPLIGRMGGGAMATAFQDQTFTVYVKGNKMARIGQTTSTITDLDAGTITIINNEKHTYSTETFDEMRQHLDEMQQRMNRGSGGSDIQFDVKIDKTGQSRTIDGETATEDIITLTAKPGSTNSQMAVRMDAWLIPPNASTRELADYFKRLSEKFIYAFGAMPGLGAAASGINAAGRAVMQLDGYPVLSEMQISGVASPMMGRSNTDPNAPFITTETRASKFVSGPVDDSKFGIPEGYTQEQPRGRRRQ